MRSPGRYGRDDVLGVVSGQIQPGFFHANLLSIFVKVSGVLVFLYMGWRSKALDDVFILECIVVCV